MPNVVNVVSFDHARLTFCVLHAERLISEAKTRLLAGFENAEMRAVAEEVLSLRPVSSSKGKELIEQIREQVVELELPQIPNPSTEPWDGTCRLTDWYTTPVPHARFFAPEMSPPMSLMGKVLGHPHFPDGYLIQTSTVVFERSKGRRIEVAEGLVVHVEEPQEKWVRWMEKNCVPFDPDRPLRIVSEEEREARQKEKAGISA